jgi:hypothetical protein
MMPVNKPELMAESGYAGKTLMPRTIAAAAKEYWRNYELTKAVAVALGESSGSLGAWHDNYRDGELHSRDCGLYQINIPASQVGGATEDRLRTDSTDPTVWEPVLDYNLERANGLYNSRWDRDEPGYPNIRLWQPWVAYTTGWATFPEWWVWRHVNGVPTGPWVKTGRFIHKAIAGQMNLHLVILQDWTTQQALYYGKRYVKHFGIRKGNLTITKAGIVGWENIPPMPSQPPTDGIGPRPVRNSGI